MSFDGANVYFTQMGPNDLRPIGRGALLGALSLAGPLGGEPLLAQGLLHGFLPVPLELKGIWGGAAWALRLFLRHRSPYIRVAGTSWMRRTGFEPAMAGQPTRSQT